MFADIFKPLVTGVRNGLTAMLNESRTPQTLRRGLNPLYYAQQVASALDTDRVHGILASAAEGETADLWALYRDMELADPVIQSSIATRKLAVLGDPWKLLPWDKTNRDDIAAANFLTSELSDLPNFTDICAHLLSATVWPVAVVEKSFEVAPGGVWRLDNLRPVPGELLDYRTRRLRIAQVGNNGEVLTQSDPVDPERYIVHRGHMLTAPDHFGGPMRSLVFWFLFGGMSREWWARFLERFGAPFFVGYYDKNDENSRYNLERAFSEATRLFGVVATRETQIEIKQASTTDGGDAFEKFHEMATREKIRSILGQTLSSQSGSTGLGSGVANLQGSVKSDYRAWDAYRLAETLRTSLFEQMLRLNGHIGRTPRIIWGNLDSQVTEGAASILTALPNAGLELTDEGIGALSQHLGLPLQRAAAPPPPPPGFGPGLPMSRLALSAGLSALPMSAAANQAITSQAAADLPRALGQDLAALYFIVSTARNGAEMRQLMIDHMRGSPPFSAAKTVEAAGAAAIANGLQS